jgi:hypothetical protein
MSDGELSEHARAMSAAGASLGGKARAEKLTPEERKEIARQAAEARWSADLPKATHVGELTIAGRVIACAVLEDQRRVLNQETFLTAIGRAAKAKAGTGSSQLIDGMPPFLAAANLKPFIADDLHGSTAPILYRTPTGGRAYGYEAKILPMVCEVYLAARDAGELTRQQKHIAKACELLTRGLAQVGIISLVDECTGFQYDRARRALEEILEQFISKELLKWAKMFPDEFYQEMFRLKRWRYNSISKKRPIQAGKLTNDLVYLRLAPFVLEELKRITPRDEKGRLKHKYHQRLTEDVGHPRLREHLSAVIALMRAFEEWDAFYKALNRALPRQVQEPLLEWAQSPDRADQIDTSNDGDD